MKKLIGMLAAVVAATLISGCVSFESASTEWNSTAISNKKTESNDTTVLNKKEVNFKSEPGSLSISNETSKDVVVFAGKIEKGTVLGGITANQTRSFNLSKLQGIPKSGALLIRVATFETYKRKAIVTEDDVIYTGLVVYDLKDAGDKIALSIYKGVDTARQTCIYVSNESENFVLELRQGNPSQGEIIATLPPLQTNKRIYLSPRDDGFAYDFYPQFVFVNPKTGEKTSMNAGKTDRKRAYPERVGGDITPMRFEGPSKSSIGYDVAFISLQNDTHSGLEFRNGETTLRNQKGIRFTPSGRTDVYEIQSTNGEAGQTYTGLQLEFDNFTKKTIEKYTFLPGYKYELIITDMNGNYQYDIREVGQKSLVEDARIQLFNE